MPDRSSRPRSLEDAGSRKLHAPATLRNRDAILEILKRVAPGEGILLELASGTGEHAAWMAPQLLPLVWQPSDPDPAMRASIAEHRAAAASPNILPPVALDVHETAWPLLRADVILCCNLLQVAPWSACEGLMAGAGRTLSSGGLLLLYGPFKRGGRFESPSNEAFDRELRARCPDWGLRDLDEVAECAQAHELDLEETNEMPANNLCLVFRRR